MTPQGLLVEVEANGSVRPRIVAALEAEGLSVTENGLHPRPELKVLAVDLSRSSSQRRLRARLAGDSSQRIVVVSPHCGSLGVRRAVRAGASSLVLEHEIEAALVAAVRAVAAGLTAVPAVLQDDLNSLTFSHRERQVLRLAITGSTNLEIATALFLAESTVKSHLSSAYSKLGAGSRKEAAAMILDPEDGLVEMVLGRDPFLPKLEKVS